MTNEWIEHDGGECPVDGETLVDVKLKDGAILLITKASDLRWKWVTEPYMNKYNDIIAYRLSKEQA